MKHSSTGTSESAIPIVSLDEALAAHIGQVAFVKIDVEGFEPFVLNGAEKLLRSENPPVVMIEFSPEALERQPIEISEFLDNIRSLGAEMTLPINGKLEVVTSPPLDVVTNLFMLPKKGRYAVKVEDANVALAIING